MWSRRNNKTSPEGGEEEGGGEEGGGEEGEKEGRRQKVRGKNNAQSIIYYREDIGWYMYTSTQPYSKFAQLNSFLIFKWAQEKAISIFKHYNMQVFPSTNLHCLTSL